MLGASSVWFVESALPMSSMKSQRRQKLRPPPNAAPDAELLYHRIREAKDRSGPRCTPRADPSPLASACRTCLGRAAKNASVLDDDVDFWFLYQWNGAIVFPGSECHSTRRLGLVDETSKDHVAEAEGRRTTPAGRRSTDVEVANEVLPTPPEARGENQSPRRGDARRGSPAPTGDRLTNPVLQTALIPSLERRLQSECQSKTGFHSTSVIPCPIYFQPPQTRSLESTCPAVPQHPSGGPHLT